MYLEIAIGSPNGATYAAAQNLGMHYTNALIAGLPPMSVMTLSENDVTACNARNLNNIEADQNLFCPAMPNIAINCNFLGRPATVCYRMSELGLFFPWIAHVRNPLQRIIPLTDAYIFAGDTRMAISLCAMRVQNESRDIPVGIMAVWQSSNLIDANPRFCHLVAYEAVAQYCAAQYYLTHRPVQLVYANRREIFGSVRNLQQPEQTNGYANPPEPNVGGYSQLELLRRLDCNPLPTAGTGKYERKTQCWEVAGHWRENPRGGDPIWVNPYRKGPARSDPDVEPLHHNYTIP